MRRTRCLVMMHGVLLAIASVWAQKECQTVEKMLTDWNLTFPWSPGSCCVGTVGPNGMPLLDSGQSVYCDSKQNIVGLNLGHGSTTGVPSTLTVTTTLNGPIPLSIGSLSSLKALLMDKNNFSGDLPDSLKNLRSLVYLDLSYNALTGSIQVLQNLNLMTGLWLASNQFNGQACALDSLTSLASLNLALNRFSGPIPVPALKLSAIDCALNNSGLCLKPGNTTKCTGTFSPCQDSDIPTSCVASTKSTMTASATSSTSTASRTASPIEESSGTFSTSAIILISLCTITGFIIVGAIGYNLFDVAKGAVAKPDMLEIETFDANVNPAPPPKFVVIGSSSPTPEPR